MLRDEVADHYRAKGYTIRERSQVRGQSGTVHTVDMVAMGPLGNLVIAFEDAGGFEGPEMGSIKRVARDIGAQAVMAARKVPDGIRKQAAEAGVVLLDDEARAIETVEAPVVSESSIEYPPWPDTAKPAPEDDDPATHVKSTDPGLWKFPREGKNERTAGFDWLGANSPSSAETVLEAQDETLAPTPIEVDPDLAAARTQVTATKSPKVTAPATRRMDARWFWTVVLLGASGGAVIFALSQLV